MRMRKAIPSGVAVALAVLLLALPAPVLAHNQPGVLRNYVTVPLAGLSAEGIANQGGHYFVSTIGFTAANGNVFEYNNQGSLLHTFTLPGLPIVGQGAIYHHDLFIVACSPALSSGAVVKINLKTNTVDTTFATIPTGCPNGLASDAHGNLYVADFAGSIDKVTQSGAVTLDWATGGLLTPGTIGTFTIGPNDMIYSQKQNALFTTNTGTNTVVEIKVNHDGSAGAISAYATVSGPDGLAFDRQGNLYVASPFTDNIYVVSPGGTSVTAMTFTGSLTLDGPTALIFHGHDMYITNMNAAGTHASGFVLVVTLQNLAK